jgi:hypothetical protein
VKLEFSRQIFKKADISSSIKILPVGDELFHADGETDGHEETSSRFSQFCGLKNTQNVNVSHANHVRCETLRRLMSYIYVRYVDTVVLRGRGDTTDARQETRCTRYSASTRC